MNRRAPPPVERTLPRLDSSVAIGSHTIAVPARQVRFRGAEVFDLDSMMAVHKLSRCLGLLARTRGKNDDSSTPTLWT
jgi:hypothetical protein